MAERLYRIPVGRFTLTVISEGSGRFPVAAWTAVTPTAWGSIEGFDGQGFVPLGFNVVYVQTPAGGVLLDAGLGEENDETRAFRERFDVEATGDVPGALAELGVTPADVRAVVITHAHNDHFYGATLERGGEQVPAFPNARYYLGAADWAHYSKTAEPGSPFHAILGTLRRLGRLELVAEPTEILPGITLLPTPGETPGHLSVAIESEGETAYYIGDLVHHTAEITHPDWVPRLRDGASLVASRRTFYTQAAERGGIVIASHIPFPGAGRIIAREGSFGWQPIRAG